MIPGLDPQTHAWIYEQLMAGVPRQPIARQLAESTALSRSDAGDLVRMVGSQALAAVSGGRVPGRKRGGNAAPALLSLWIPGLGQLTQGRPGRGLAMFGISALLWVILLGWVMHITAAVDAAKWDPIE